MPGNSHVLVIDDNEDILFMLQAMFSMQGYKVSLKKNMDNLEAFLIEMMPDIILMDMLLSGADGREVCRLLKANPNFSQIPVIMISAHPDAREKCLEAGANYFVEKPFEMNDILQIVSVALV